MIITGERQYGKLQEIRRDHLARYEFVAKLLSKKDLVVDAACGCGYGTYLIAQKAKHVIGFDNSSEAIDYAIRHYASGNSFFDEKTLPCDMLAADVTVCFETLEHMDNPLELLKSFRKTSIKLFASVPNQSVLPFKEGQFPFHYRHYTKDEFQELLNKAGWQVNQWYGQKDAWGDVEKDVNGRTLVVECI